VLHLLLDIHIKPEVAAGVAAHRSACLIESLRERSSTGAWTLQGGQYRTALDPDILAAAHEDGVTLVTYDLKSIPLLLRTWGAIGRSHGGVIFGDHKTILANDVGGQIRGLIYLWDTRGQEGWTNVVDYLRPASRSEQ
jgi:hypothetical protein